MATPEVLDESVAFTHMKSVVRVRPWLPKEAKVVPEKQVVPRPALEYKPAEGDSGVITDITVLDPINKFKPKKGGSFSVDAVLWSFFDEGATPLATPVGSPAASFNRTRPPPGIPASQVDTFNIAGAPLVDCLMAGYNVGCVVAGGPSSGKHYTLIGDEYWSGEPRGILPRFLFDLFERQQKAYREDSATEIDVECLAVNNDNITDLLKKGKSTDDLKVREDADGVPTVVGSTRQPAEDVLSLEPILKSAVQKHGKSYKSSHLVITIRITDIWSFKDPLNPTASLKKQRKSYATFVMLNGSHLGFQRCLDAAIARDSGETPQAKVPSRDSSLTRILADLFGGNCNVSFVSCVSPFYEHSKDAMNTLSLASKLNVIKCHAKVNTDNSMSELRKLDDEVRTLEAHVQKESETIAVVQNELDRRADLLREKQKIAAEHKAALEAMEYERRLAENMKEATVISLKHTQKNRTAQEKKLNAEREAARNEEKALIEEKEKIYASIAAGEAAMAVSDATMESQRAETVAVQEKVDNAQAFEGEVAEQEDIVKSSGARLQAIEKKHKERMSKAQTDKTAATEQLSKDEKALEAVSAKHSEVKTRHDDYKKKEKELKDLEAGLAKDLNEEKELQKQIELLEQEIKQLEEEKNKKGCCAVS